MEDRPYAVLVENGITRFVLPRRARTFFQKVGGWCLLVTGGVGATVAVGCLLWLWSKGGLNGEFLKWGIVGGVAACAAAFKFGWAAFRGGQGEVCVCLDGDFLRVTHLRGPSAKWETLALSKIDRLRVVDATGDFAPKDNMALWATRSDSTTEVIVKDYPQWVIEMLAADLERLIEEAKTRPTDAEG